MELKSIVIASHLQVEMGCEGDKYEKYGNEKSGCDPGSEVRLKLVELDPAEDADLHQEKEDPQHCAKTPSHFNYRGHL